MILVPYSNMHLLVIKNYNLKYFIIIQRDILYLIRISYCDKELSSLRGHQSNNKE